MATIKRTPAQRLAIGVGVLVVLAFIGAGAVSVASGVVIQSKDTSRTFVEAVSSLHVEVDGDIAVQTGPDGQVTVATHQVWSFHQPSITETRSGTNLAIAATCPTVNWGTCNTSVRLVVPAALVLNLTSQDGDVSVDGVQGALTLQSDTGDVSVTSASGPLHLSSDNGSVSGTDLTSKTVRASSQNGDVGLLFADAPDTVNASSDNGEVSVLLPHGPASYLVSASSENGIRSVGVPNSATSDRRIVVDSEDGDVSVDYAS